MIDITNEERYKLLFDQLPTGFYRLDEHDKIIDINKALLSMLDYNDVSNLIGKHVKELYSDEEKELENRKQTIEKGTLLNQSVELLKKNGESIFTLINAKKIVTLEGEYLGREGTIIYVAKEELYRKILSDVPVGFYMVRKENGKGIIKNCNEQFNNIFEFKNNETAIGLDITDLYSTSDDIEPFMKALNEADNDHVPLLGYPLKVKTKTGKEITIEVNTRFSKDKNDKLKEEQEQLEISLRRLN